jgi:Ca-activated chloride channel family protein
VPSPPQAPVWSGLPSTMSFIWAHNLWLMLALPLLVALYLWLLRRRRRTVLRFSSVALARQAGGPAWRRHIPPALIGLALAIALLSLARPSARLTLPRSHATILLAIDVSRSMRVQDVLPTRMVAAQQAARALLHESPPNLHVGIGTFAGTAQVAQQATLDRPSRIGAIDAIQMRFGTAIGSAIVVCLAELFPEHQIDLSAMIFGPASKKHGWDERGRAPTAAFTPVAPGSYDAAAIILLSDGRRTKGSTRCRPRRGPPSAASASMWWAWAPPTDTWPWAKTWPSICSSTNPRCARWRG